MYDVQKGSRELLEGLDSGLKSKQAKKWDIIYNILKALGIIGTGVALVNFGVTAVFGVVAGSIFSGLLGIYQFKVQPARFALKKEEDKKIALALEVSSKNGVPVDIKHFDTKLVAVDEDTKDATFVKSNTGEEITYDKVGKKTFYFKYSDVNGDNHLLAGTETRTEVSDLSNNGRGYITYVSGDYSVSGLESEDEDALSRHVVNQIADYMREQEVEVTNNKKKTRNR